MVFQSAHPPVEIPTTGVVEFLFENRNNIPQDQPIFIDSHSDRVITFGEFKQKVLQFGGGLRSYCNLQLGDVICIYAPNLVSKKNIKSKKKNWFIPYSSFLFFSFLIYNYFFSFIFLLFF